MATLLAGGVLAAAALTFPGRGDALPAGAWLPGSGTLDPTERMARVEGRQPDGSGELGGLTLDELLDRLGVPGASVAVIHDFEIHWAKGYGVADRATGTSVDTATLFQSASISKPISAMLGVRLVQDGVFGLDDDVNSLLVSWRVPPGEGWSAPVTLRSLWSHTSGADDGFGFPGYPPGFRLPTAIQILDGASPSNVGPVRFARPPFRAFKYSGGGSTVLQLALAERTETPFDVLARTHLLEPLGMRSSTFTQPLPAELHGRAARAHDARGARFLVPWHDYPELAAAGLWTTASDLARALLEVQHALAGRETRLLTAPSARELTTPVGVGPFAVGFHLEKRGEGWYFGHTGSNRGFQSAMLAHLRHGYGVVVLTNGSNGSRVAAEVRERVARAYDWDAHHAPLRR